MSKIRINDFVTVLAGKNKGATGNVTRVLAKQDKVVVDGVNKQVKHVKKRDGQAGERVEFFAPIHVSNVAVADPKDGKPTRVGYKVDGKTKTRISRRSGEAITATAPKAKKTTKKDKDSSSDKK